MSNVSGFLSFASAYRYSFSVGRLCGSKLNRWQKGCHTFLGLSSLPYPILFLKQLNALLYGFRVMQKKLWFLFGLPENRAAASPCTFPSNPSSREFLIVEQATFGFEIKVNEYFSQ